MFTQYPSSSAILELWASVNLRGGVMSDPHQSQLCLQTTGSAGQRWLLNVHPPQAGTLGICLLEVNALIMCQDIRRVARLLEKVLEVVSEFLCWYSWPGVLEPIRGW